PDMRMRPHVEAITCAEFGWTEMIEENEGTDHACARRRQRTADGKVTEVHGAGHDHLAYGITLIVISCLWILAGKETHGRLLCTDSSLARGYVEKTQRIAASDATHLLRGKLNKPAAIFLEDRIVAEPALIDPSVRTEQEAIRMKLK